MSPPALDLVEAWAQLHGPRRDDAWAALAPVLRKHARIAARTIAPNRDPSFADELAGRCCARLLDRAGRDPLPALQHEGAIVRYLATMLRNDAKTLLLRAKREIRPPGERDDEDEGDRETAERPATDRRWHSTPPDVLVEHTEELRRAGLESGDVLGALEAALDAVADAVGGAEPHRERRLRALRQVTLLDVHGATLDEALRATGDLNDATTPADAARARNSAYQAHRRVRLRIVELCEADAVPPPHGALLRAWDCCTHRRARPGAKP